ncbi:hypothetical protein KC901_02270 [Patescibacteria group bacterium]|nr:hypothetical protein [Patescibacteria group bacterium]
MKIKYTMRYIAVVCAVVTISCMPVLVFAQAGSVSSTISITGSERVAAGDTLPVNIQLLNFGTPGENVDVSLNFVVRNELQEIVLNRTETVAVQTTASFTRYFQIPKSLNPGHYVLNLDVNYRNQKFPAIAEQRFIVERQFLGYGISKWYPAVPFGLVPFVYIFLKRRRREKYQSVADRDYSHVPEQDRTNYEIIHDIVNLLHYHVGDKKIREIAAHIPGLILNQSNSHVQKIDGSMERIISQLIHEYETIMGKRVNIISQPSFKKKRVQTH